MILSPEYIGSGFFGVSDVAPSCVVGVSLVGGGEDDASFVDVLEMNDKGFVAWIVFVGTTSLDVGVVVVSSS